MYGCGSIPCPPFRSALQPELFHGQDIPRRILFGRLRAWVVPCLGPSLTVYLVCIAVWHLCRMPHTQVKLRGLGLVWAWLALLGSLAAMAITWRAAALVGPFGPSAPQISGISVPFTFQMILAISALTGYALLLARRRVGLYVILLGTGLMLAAQAMQGVSAIGSRFAWALIIPALVGAVNPLLAWLAVCAGETPDGAAPESVRS